MRACARSQMSKPINTPSILTLQAVSYFEKTFEIARNVGDSKLVNAARINLGMARGNLDLDAYMDVVNQDLKTLLQWKSKRTEFK